MARTSKNSESQSKGQGLGEVNGSEATTIDKPAVAAAAAKVSEVSPEMRAKLAQIRSRVETSVGQVVLLLMQLPRYRHQALGDLNHLVLEPLLRDRVAVAYAKRDGEQAEANSAPIGVAIWATVNDEVDRKIEEQAKAGIFPLRLRPDEWNSGKKPWLLDIVTLNRQSASAVLANFKQIAGDSVIKLHPIVSQSVDSELLSALVNSPQPDDQKSPS